VQCSASVARIRFFDGTQPVLTQVPPIVPCPTSATRAPSSAAVIAAENPAEPAPTIAMSQAPFSPAPGARRSSGFSMMVLLPSDRLAAFRGVAGIVRRQSAPIGENQPMGE
jgi:hypothetical protein